jgi:integrase
LEELGQLRSSDIAERAYVDDAGVEHRSWFITITSDDSAGLTLKNAASERVVPVHATLVDRGLLAFVAASQRAKEPRLFPRLRPNVYGRLTAKWGEWFDSYLRKSCGVTDRRMVFHSFRHTFKHYARHVGVNEGIQRQIMGHSSGDAADQYGSGYSLWQLVGGMSLFAVPGLSLPL